MNRATTLSDELAATRMSQLGNLTRLRILRLLVRAEPGGLSVGAIQRQLGIPASTLSHHLAGLCRAALVNRQRDGAVLHCRADMRHLEELTEFLTGECCAGTEE